MIDKNEKTWTYHGRQFAPMTSEYMECGGMRRGEAIMLFIESLREDARKEPEKATTYNDIAKRMEIAMDNMPPWGTDWDD